MSDQAKLTLRPSKTSTLLYLATCAAFAAVGVLMIVNDQSSGWFVALAFGLGGLVFVLQLLPNCSYLRLTPDGFTVCSLFRAHTYRWADVTRFGVTRIGLNKMVAFDFANDYDRGRTARRVAAGLSGYEGALPDSYGMKPEQLAEVMNQWKTRGGRRRTAPSPFANGAHE